MPKVTPQYRQTPLESVVSLPSPAKIRKDPTTAEVTYPSLNPLWSE